MSNGLKGKVKEMVTRMNAIRQNPDGGRDIGLRTFMAENYRNNGEALTPEHLYAELGIDPHVTRVKDLMADEDAKYLMSEIIRDGVRQGMGAGTRERIASQGPIITNDTSARRWLSPEVFLEPQALGLVQASFYQDLIVRDEPVQNKTVTVPKLELADAELKDTTEAQTIEEGTVTYGDKQVTLAKKARGIKISYEAIAFNTLSLVQLFFLDAGRILGHSLNKAAVDVLVNGDAAGEGAGVVGVDTVANKIAYIDYSRAATRGGLIGRNFSQIIANEDMANFFLNLPEVKNLQNGNSIFPITTKTPRALPTELFTSGAVPPNQVILNDPLISIVKLTAQPLMVETDKIIAKQIAESYASIITGFAKLARNASFIFDGSIAFSGAGFPTYLTPLA